MEEMSKSEYLGSIYANMETGKARLEKELYKEGKLWDPLSV